MSHRKLKLNESGKSLYFGAGEDISAATSYTVEFISPNGVGKAETPTLGLEDITGDDQYGNAVLFLENEYATLAIPAGLFDEVGRWQYRLLAPTATGSVPGDCGVVEVVA